MKKATMMAGKPRRTPAWVGARTDWLYNGHRAPSEEIWALLKWSKAYVDLGPSPMGNLGPYWHVPLEDGEGTVQRLYPKVLLSKWLLIVRQACIEYAALEVRRAEQRAAEREPGR